MLFGQSSREPRSRPNRNEGIGEIGALWIALRYCVVITIDVKRTHLIALVGKSLPEYYLIDPSDYQPVQDFEELLTEPGLRDRHGTDID